MRVRIKVMEAKVRMNIQNQEELINEIYEWFSVGENYSVVHFAIEHGMSKEELFKVCEGDEELKKALDYAMSVQEYKVAEGALRGMLDRNVAIKMLETYSGWKMGRDENVGAIFAQIGESKLGIIFGGKKKEELGREEGIYERVIGGSSNGKAE